MKKGLIWLLSIVVILVMVIGLCPLVLPSGIEIKRSVEIEKSPAEVYAYVADLELFSEYDLFWGGMEPPAEVTVAGGDLDATLQWRGTAAGQGKITRTRLEQDQLVQSQIDLLSPKQRTIHSEWKLEPNSTGTEVIWTYRQELPYFGRYVGFLADDVIGSNMEIALDYLKDELDYAGEVPEEDAPMEEITLNDETFNDSAPEKLP